MVFHPPTTVMWSGLAIDNRYPTSNHDKLMSRLLFAAEKARAQPEIYFNDLEIKRLYSVYEAVKPIEV